MVALSVMRLIGRRRHVIMSGIQPTGIPHIGNWLGAIEQIRLLQESGHNEVFVCIADLHSITVAHQPQILRQNILNMAASLLACGIDYKNTVLFQQSAVLSHANLAWVLGCQTSISLLEHQTQWKQKSASGTKLATSTGLFTYPVLQTADILAYKATHVPVGEDQLKHLELTRHIAKLFNNKFGILFPLPETLTVSSKRIKSLRNPDVKMSKSDITEQSRILLTDSADKIQMKVRKAVTDTTPSISYDPASRPGISNLVDIVAAFTGQTASQVCDSSQHLDTVGFKNYTADVIIERLRPISAEIHNLLSDLTSLGEIIRTGNERASNVANATYDEVCRRVGFL